MRKTIIAIGGIIIALLLAYTGYRGYRVWRQNHWLTLAKTFAAKGDGRNELLSLQQVLRMNPENLEACILMGNLSDAAHSPTALSWRQRALDIAPNSFTNRLALIRTALDFGDFEVASNALAGVQSSEHNTAAYHNIRGVMATRVGNMAKAGQEFSEAVKLAPGNPVLKMNLAVLRLHGSNATERANARVELRQISQSATNAFIRNRALRELVADGINSTNLKQALEFSAQLVQQKQVAFSDRLLRLEVLQRAKQPGFEADLAKCQQSATNGPVQLSAMARWMLRSSTPAKTLSWLLDLPVALQTNQPAALLIADCQTKLHDWHRLQTGIQNQNWGDLEFIRHTLLSLALREEHLKGASSAEWSVAMKYANDQKGRLISLLQLVSGWGWRARTEQILWDIVNRYPEEKWAPPILTKALVSDGSTRSLMNLFNTLYQRNPNNAEMKNNLAFTALLLGASGYHANELAQQVYQNDRQNPSYASTYAFSLYLQKKYAEALKVMQQFPGKDLKQPSVAGYYGLILQASGEKQKARPYLRLAFKGHLLPQEKQLFQQALGS